MITLKICAVLVVILLLLDLCQKIAGSDRPREIFMKWVRPESVKINEATIGVIYKKSKNYAAVEYINKNGIWIKHIFPLSMIKTLNNGNSELHNTD